MIEPVSVPILLDLELSEEEYELTAEELEEINLQLKSIISINQVYGGLPSGGEQGDIIIKKSNQDYDAEWVPPANTLESGNKIPVTASAVYEAVSQKVDKESGKGLSSNDYTNEEKTKLANIATGAQANIIETIKLHGTALPVTDKSVDINVLPSGGTNGQVLQRVGANDYSVGWATLSTIAWHDVSVDNVDEDGKLPSDQGLPITTIRRELANGQLPIIRCTDNNVRYNLIYAHGRAVPMYFCCVDNNGVLRMLRFDYADEETSGGGREVDWFYSVITLDQSSELDTVVDELSRRITQLGTWLDTKKVEKETGKGLSTNDYTTAEKNKLAGIAAGAQVNAVEGISIDNGSTTLTPDANKNIILLTAGYGSNGLMSQSDFIKLQGISDQAEMNIIDSVRVNGSEVPVQNKTVDITVPTTVAELTDAADYVTDTEFQETISSSMSTVSAALALKADASAVYTKTEVDQKLVGAMNYKGTKATVADLPSSGNKKGDMWHVTATGGEYAWNGSAWEEMGSVIDLSGYVEEDDIGIATTSQIDELFDTSGS